MTATSAAARVSSSTPDDQLLILFGATGDLAKRKLLPASSISLLRG